MAPFLRITDSLEGPVLYSGERPLYHPQNPKSRAAGAARREHISAHTLVLVPSPLFGYGLDVLLENLPEESRVLCVEHDKELMAASLRHFPPELMRDSRVAFIRAADAQEVCRFAERRFGTHLFRRVAVVCLSRGYSLFPDFYRGLSARLLDMIQSYWRNRMTSLHIGRLWMGNLFTNLALLPACLPAAHAGFTRPLFIAGAGESLEKHLGFLSARRAEFALICVDTALPVLRAAGISPDLIIIAEAQFANIYDFAGLRDWNIPIAADLCSYPGILRRFTGPRYIFLSRFTGLSWFSRSEVQAILPPFIPPLGSVGVMALYLACRAAAQTCPVFLTGMDLRYPAGKPHAKSSPSHTLFLAGQHRLSFPRYLASWYGRPRENAPLARGGMVPADAVLASYRNILQEIAQSRKNIFTLEGEGLDLGSPTVSHSEAAAIIRAFQPPAAPAFPDAPAPAAPAFPDASTVEAFRDSQARELEAIAASPVLHTASLERCDYLFLDCPENPPYPLEDPGFIRRIQERAAWYSSRLRRGINAL
ncbi:MAG: DUF115 domain-containing protein [Spirochaetales bacterium]|jgi:hypothetical protein|nr:DUF115 domain-containing protein [Spirochaetales bacterium]